jgi:nucleoid DNA-binding protein
MAAAAKTQKFRGFRDIATRRVCPVTANPGEAMPIKASKKVAFRPAKELKEAV